MFLVVVEPDHNVDLRALKNQLQLPGGQIAFASTDRLENIGHPVTSLDFG